MNRLRQIARPLLHLLLLSFTAMSIYAPASQATIIGTEQALNQKHTQQQAQNARYQLQQILAEDSVTEQLEQWGVNSADIQSRIANMSDQELISMAEKMDQLPAGQGVVSLLFTLFLVLLITDILGYTDIFPFVKHHH